MDNKPTIDEQTSTRLEYWRDFHCSLLGSSLLRSYSYSAVLFSLLFSACHTVSADSQPRHIPLSAETGIEASSDNKPLGDIYLSLDAWGEANQASDSSDPNNGLFAALYLSLYPTTQIALNAAIENDFSGDTSFDELYVSWQDTKGRIAASFGKQYLPFGNYDSGLSSTPLTYSLGGTLADQMLAISLMQNQTALSAYAFKTESLQLNSDKTHPIRIRLRLDYEDERKSLGVSFLSNLAESFADMGSTAEEVPAVSLYSITYIDKWQINAEHITALKAFAVGDFDGDIEKAFKPSATHAEIIYNRSDDNHVALGWSGTHSAEALDIDQHSFGLAIGRTIHKNVDLTAEIIRNQDYDDNSNLVISLSMSIGKYWEF